MSALTVIAIGIVCVSLGVLLVRGVFFGYPESPRPRALFGRKEQAIVAACADTLFPAGGPIPLSGTQAGLIGYMDTYVRRLSASSRYLIRLLFWFLEHGPWIFGPRRARFTRLAHEDRLAVLDDMAKSSIYFRRVAFLSMRAMLTMGYLAHPDVARKMGMVARLAPFDRASSAEGVAAGARREAFA